jgi:ubiquinone/menaquinone biosynthesis C-methylase UbiE
MPDHFNLIAPFYERVIRPPDPERLKSLLRLPVAGRLLDAGGGTGRVTTQLRPLIDEVVISDLSAGMLQQARQKGDLWPLQAHAEKLPFPDGSFDRVLVVDALHHFCHQEQAVADLVRVLKPGGRLVIEEPNLEHFRVKLIALAEKLALMRSHFYYPAAIQAMIARQGLAAVIERDDQFTTWVVVDK